MWVPTLSPKGYYLFNCYKRYVLCDGPRKSTKSVTVDNRLCRHLWEVKNARVGIVSKTLGQGKVGVWDDLTGWIVQQWIEAGIGFDYSQRPKMEADTKMSSFRVRNMWGGESICQLHSLQHEQDVEIRFKDLRFSMIYLVEADKFKERKTFTVLTDQLRALGVPYDQHQFIADCNPPEEGDEHFLHDIFIKRFGTGNKPDPEFDKKFERIQFLLEDNIFLSKEEMEEQLEKYRYDPDLYARWTEGKWVKYAPEGHFKDVYVPTIHVAGNVSSPNQEDWDILSPTEQCIELFSGTDPGDTNHAMVIAAKRELGSGTCFDIIDELVLLDNPVPIDKFVELFLEKMDFWELLMKEKYNREKIRWRHWSDLSAFKYNAAADTYVHQMVHEYSGGRIIFNNAGRLPGFVSQRLSLVKKLLYQKRIVISAQLRYTQAMFRNLKKGKLASELIDPHAPEKHVFDALTYMLANEAPMDMERRNRPVTTRTLISVPA